MNAESSSNPEAEGSEDLGPEAMMETIKTLIAGGHKETEKLSSVIIADTLLARKPIFQEITQRFDIRNTLGEILKELEK